MKKEDLLLYAVTDRAWVGEQTLYEAIGLEGKSGIIGVNEAKRIFEKLSLKSFEGKYKTMVIYLPEKMNQEAANKLLKLLEEPPAGTLFILVSHAPEKILSTIRSRCQRIQLMPLSREQRQAAGKGSQSNPEFQELLTGIIKAGLNKALADTIPVWEYRRGTDLTILPHYATHQIEFPKQFLSDYDYRIVAD